VIGGFDPQVVGLVQLLVNFEQRVFGIAVLDLVDGGLET
jgi:hypothetical protein